MKKYKNPYDKYYNPYYSYDKKKKYYYPTVDAPVQYPKEDYYGMEEMDMNYMKKMYPDICKRLQYYIDEECDKMEYDGSYMYDEYPDKEAIEMLTDKIYEMIEKDEKMMAEEIETTDNTVNAQRRYNRWLRNLVKVMLLNEIFRRRGRRNRRRRRIYYPSYGYNRPYRGRPYGDYYPDYY